MDKEVYEVRNNAEELVGETWNPEIPVLLLAAQGSKGGPC